MNVELVCAVEGCGTHVYARSHCSRHYRQLLKHGETRPDREAATCDAPGCSRLSSARGWCSGHYQRWLRTGDIQAEIPLGRYGPASCGVVGCVRPRHAQGFCITHYQRWKSHGDPRAEEPVRTRTGSGFLHHGYRRVPVPPDQRWLVGGATNAAEHRLVMARALGRPLSSDESVHHINGDRSDNRPENL